MAHTTFASGEFASLQEMIERFLGETGLRADAAALGVAGPVMAGKAQVTNLPWVLSEEDLQNAFGFRRVRLLNDLLAVAYAVPSLQPADLLTLNEGEPVEQGAIAVVAPGTGLGEAYLIWNGTRYEGFPSEGGHADYAPVDDLQQGLLRFMRDRCAHVSVERVCSGKGLPNLYAYLKESGFAEEPEELAARMAAAADPARVIVQGALDSVRPCLLCRATVKVFFAILAAECGNLALKVMASGGVYLGGGLPLRLLPLLQTDLFLEIFRQKGRMRNLMERIPIHIIRQPKAALQGAAAFALEHFAS